MHLPPKTFFAFSLCARFSLGGQVCHFQELICEKEEVMVPPCLGLRSSWLDG